jgi:hydrogenase maturation protein HypF
MTPAVIACDLHPDYFTSRLAESKTRSAGLVRVQHHHAHIASCMAEHGLDEPVLGVAMDGTGYGSDGNTWGAEFFYCDLAGFTRDTHFEHVPLPGGDRGVEEPWRMAVSYLFKTFGEDFTGIELPFLKEIDPEKVDIIVKMIRTKINCPLVSSAGRLFDAVSAILGLCLYSTFSAEAPMRLESIIEPGILEYYPFSFSEIVNFDFTIAGILGDLKQQVSPGIISAKFHNTLISMIAEVTDKMRAIHFCKKVVLSGGTFQNKYLLEGTEKALRRNGFDVYSHRVVPTNDGGISLGQLAVAAKRRELGVIR